MAPRESVLNKIVTSGILDIWEILEDSSENSACYPWQISRNVHDFNQFENNPKLGVLLIFEEKTKKKRVFQYFWSFWVDLANRLPQYRE